MVKSAGNDNADASLDRGNRAAGAIIVGASDRYDYRASFSNFGSIVDVFGPGAAVRVATNASSTGTDLYSGTSFAAPYTAGVAAAALESEPAASPYRIEEVIVKSATEGVLTSIGTGSPNRLLYSLFTSVRIDGPSEIETKVSKSITWAATTSGGSGTFTYQWEAAVNAGAYSVVSTAPTYTRSFLAGEQFTLMLRLTVASGGDSRVTSMTVNVTRPPEPCGSGKAC